MEAEVGPLRLALDPYQCGRTATRQHWRVRRGRASRLTARAEGQGPEDTPLGPTLEASKPRKHETRLVKAATPAPRATPRPDSDPAVRTRS